MPPHGGRFPGHNLSNPFAHLSGPIPQQQQSLHQHQQQQQQQQQSMQHPGFGGGNQANSLNLFGQHQGGFQSNAALSAGLGGAGLGAAAAIGGAGGGTGLDGHEARMRFAHGAQIQENAARGHDGAKGIVGQRIRQVWRSNLHQEMDMLRSLIDQYPYISMVSLPFPTTHCVCNYLSTVFLVYTILYQWWFYGCVPCNRLYSIPPELSSTMLTLSIGHRIPRCCRATNWRFQFKGLISLPNRTLQCRPTQDHPAGCYPFQRPRRRSPNPPRHQHSDLQAQVIAKIRKQHCSVPLYMVVQLPVLPRRRHVQRRVNSNAKEVWR